MAYTGSSPFRFWMHVFLLIYNTITMDFNVQDFYTQCRYDLTAAYKKAYNVT